MQLFYVEKLITFSTARPTHAHILLSACGAAKKQKDEQ